MNARLSAAQIRDEQWVARYVAGRLSQAEFDAFEEYCIDHPTMVEEVMLEQRMRSALAGAAEKAPAQFRDLKPRRWMLPAAAAAMIAVVAGAVLMLSRTSPLSDLPALASLAGFEERTSSLAQVGLAQTRGRDPASLGGASQAVMQLTLTGHFDLPGTYDITLFGATDEKAVAKLMLTASDPGEMRLIMNGARIPAGSYTLRVVNVATGDVQEFDFRKE